MAYLLLSPPIPGFRAGGRLCFLAMLVGALAAFLPLAFGWESVALPFSILALIAFGYSLVLALADLARQVWRLAAGGEGS